MQHLLWKDGWNSFVPKIAINDTKESKLFNQINSKFLFKLGIDCQLKGNEDICTDRENKVLTAR